MPPPHRRSGRSSPPSGGTERGGGRGQTGRCAACGARLGRGAAACPNCGRRGHSDGGYIPTSETLPPGATGEPAVEVDAGGVGQWLRAVGSQVERMVAFGHRRDMHELHQRARSFDHDEARFFQASIEAQAQAGLLPKDPEPRVPPPPPWDGATPAPPPWDDDPATEPALAAGPDDGYWECPRCHVELVPETVQGVHLHGCGRCGGFAVERDSEPVLRAPEHRAALIAFERNRGFAPTADGSAIAYLSCPRCSGPMARQNFEKVSGVIVDRCPTHGLWLDAGELERMLRFLDRGGEARRAQFERREQEHLADQRAKIRRIEQQSARQGYRDGWSTWSGDFDL